MSQDQLVLLAQAVTDNAVRLVADAKLLLENGRYASSTMLSVHAFEEVGKVLLTIWRKMEDKPKGKHRTSFHIYKQQAAASLIIAYSGIMAIIEVMHAKKSEGSSELSFDEAKELIYSDDQKIFEYLKFSNMRLYLYASTGVTDKLKQISTYYDEPLRGNENLVPSRFEKSDAEEMLTDAELALSLLKNLEILKQGRLVFIGLQEHSAQNPFTPRHLACILRPPNVT